MSETVHILVLANSKRAGGMCVAGKRAAQLPDGTYKIGTQWIRLTHPGGVNEGTVPYFDTICRPNGAFVRPLDLIQVNLLDRCNNLDHPEDWTYDPKEKWKWKASFPPGDLASLAEAPDALWHIAESDAVPAGYVRAMSPLPASLYLVKAPAMWTFKYFKEWNRAKGYEQKKRRLQFAFSGKCHDFSVTDPMFDRRFDLPNHVSHWPSDPQVLTAPNPLDCYFCLSLTPEFNGRHYKICATFFET